MEEEKWHQLQRTQGDSKFTKNLAVMIWGTETLKNRSVTGVATKKKKDALPKPPLSPSKLKIVRGKIKPVKSRLWKTMRSCLDVCLCKLSQAGKRQVSLSHTHEYEISSFSI